LEGAAPAKPTAAPLTGQAYTVQPGETLSGLAEQFNVPWQSLAELNQIPYPYLLYYGQTLQLPDSVEQVTPEGTPTSQPSPTPSPVPTGIVDTAGTHVVRPGESLIGLSNHYQVTWQELVAVNALTYPYFIYPDQLLRLPLAAAEPTPTLEPTQSIVATATPPPAAAGQTYIVQPGDTLFKLGRQFNLDWMVIAETNSIAYPYRLYAGQTLEIP
jgi:LysM repeat protein